MSGMCGLSVQLGIVVIFLTWSAHSAVHVPMNEQGGKARRKMAQASSTPTSAGENTSHVPSVAGMPPSAVPNSVPLPGTPGFPGFENILNSGAITIYNSTFAPNWTSSDSYGCVECDWEDTARARNSSSASLYASMLPWTAIVLDTKKPFTTSNRVLDFWMTGPGITQIEIVLFDRGSRRYSRRFQFSDPVDALAPVSPLTVLSSDPEGWIHMQLLLSPLTVTSIGALDIDQGTWDRIVLQDISGAPFLIQLDDLKLIKAPYPGQGDAVGTPEAPPVAKDLFPAFLGLAFNHSDFPSSLVAPPAPSVTELPLLPKLPLFNNLLQTTLSTENHYIMRMAPSATFGSLIGICRELNGLILGQPRFDGACDPLQNNAKNASDRLDWDFQSFTVKSPSDLNSMRALLANSVLYFERDLSIHLLDPINQDPTSPNVSAPHDYLPGAAAPLSWGLDRIDQVSLPLDNDFSPGADGSGVHIFILDTGARWSHSEFTSPNNRVGDGVSMVSDTWWDGHGHGTFCAGIALGTVSGVAKKATLHAVKVLDDSGSGKYSQIISGMGWVANYVAQHGIQNAVVSMSLAGPRSQSVNDAVESLVKNNIKVVAAAGNNNGGDACSYSPASAPSAITVGASTQKDYLATFSNIGSCLNTFAPGASITSASYSGDDATSVMSGTSMSGPFVAGAVALYLQYNSGAGIQDVKAALDEAADDITFSSSSPSKLLNVMRGRLNPLRTAPPPNPLPPNPPPPNPPPPNPPPKPVSTPKPSTSPPPATVAPISKPLPPSSLISGSPASGSLPSWCTWCKSCMFC